MVGNRLSRDLGFSAEDGGRTSSAAKVMAVLQAGGFLAAPAAAAAASVMLEGNQQAALPVLSTLPGPNQPHGGCLVNRELTGEARDAARARAETLPKIALWNRELSDLEMIGVGALSPLTGFMNRTDYMSVLESMHLANGTAWTLPVTLSVSHEEGRTLALG